MSYVRHTSAACSSPWEPIPGAFQTPLQTDDTVPIRTMHIQSQRRWHPNRVDATGDSYTREHVALQPTARTDGQISARPPARDPGDPNNRCQPAHSTRHGARGGGTHLGTPNGLPASRASTHTVLRGEAAQAIAATFSVRLSVVSFQPWNKIRNVRTENQNQNPRRRSGHRGAGS